MTNITTFRRAAFKDHTFIDNRDLLRYALYVFSSFLFIFAGAINSLETIFDSGAVQAFVLDYCHLTQVKQVQHQFSEIDMKSKHKMNIGGTWCYIIRGSSGYEKSLYKSSLPIKI